EMTFDDAADVPIWGNLAPYTSFPNRPVDPLSVLNGKEASGKWKLRIEDTVVGHRGYPGCAEVRIRRRVPLCCPFQGCTPLIVTAPPALVTGESCRPANGAPDRDERVTVSLPLNNQGTGATADLEATLLPGGGVLAPSGPQSYGMLGPVGPPVAHSFSF